MIPFEFDPPPDKSGDAHLVRTPATGGHHLSWPLVGVSLFIPKFDYYLSWDAVEAENGGKFKAYNRCGFSIGQYHEFIVEGEAVHCCFKMGAIEATFGQITPLASVLFDPFHDEGDYGEWSYFSSVRIRGASAEQVEAALINALIRYERLNNVTLELLDIQELNTGVEFEEVEPVVEASSPIITNIEPLRFFYMGLGQYDDASACISYYRVIEYFSFFTNAQDMKKLRNDPSVNDLEFAKRMLDLVSRDEKGPIFKLVQTIADASVVADAFSAGLIKQQTSYALAEGLYAFRNSIVHGKFSYGFSLHSTSVFDVEDDSGEWEPILKRLALAAMEQFGSTA